MESQSCKSLRRELVKPFQLPGVGIERKHGARVQVVAGAVVVI